MPSPVMLVFCGLFFSQLVTHRTAAASTLLSPLAFRPRGCGAVCTERPLRQKQRQ